MSNHQNSGQTIKFELDGQQVEARAGETIWQVAKRQGTEIPHLCYSPAPDYRPDGNCRAAWSRSRASACWQRLASARLRSA